MKKILPMLPMDKFVGVSHRGATVYIEGKKSFVSVTGEALFEIVTACLVASQAKPSKERKKKRKKK